MEKQDLGTFSFLSMIVLPPETRAVKRTAVAGRLDMKKQDLGTFSFLNKTVLPPNVLPPDS